MKKLLLGILGCSLLLLVAFHTSGQKAPINPPVPSPTIVQVYPFATPVKLAIPKLHISTHIESVGLDKTSSMDVPKDFQAVGWYKLGFKPGQKGSAVIAGHYDTPQGTPGVFYNLSTLKRGDSIQISDDKNNKLTYTVEKIQTYPLDTFPLQTVFASTDAYRLNLITCDGIFDKSKKLYNKRLVVFATLKK